MTAQVQVSDKIQRFRILHNSKRVTHPFIKGVISKLSVALAMTIHLDPQDGRASFIRCFLHRNDMPFLHVPGKAMDENHQRTPALFFRHIQFCM